ncbi:MAG: AAA family ATPase [Gammaproteobacteria bacterium]|nr:AAA family ATPase [Gammaproteobacteria bacterium]MBT8106226.1 AAA family ATPase [Gammaproteobacteria bacterium]NNK26240.1 AAA family ATPase [Woeseiaceae bacterium]NNL63127.1 AAA family ATPase [Woeseiaceae bacterium]
MDERHDLELMLRSQTPLIVIESQDEQRMLRLLQSITIARASEAYLPLFRWTITDGLQRLDISLEPQTMNSDPTDVLKHIRAVTKPGIYVLLDFHPFLEDPVHVRLLKDICIRARETSQSIILLSHEVRLPDELERFTARFDMALPSEEERERIIKQVARDYARDNPGTRVQVDRKAHELLITNLAGLTWADTERLARNAIYVDGAITRSDLPGVMQAKYELLNRGGALQFEYDTARFKDVGGLERLKTWLGQRRAAFRGDQAAAHLDTPKGILLLGVQGCGKSLAAKATAGVFGAPLLRLDFGAVYDKYHGETERKLRESLRTADIMSPCVLWVDEIEKGIAGRGGETGTTQRVLGSLLTWMAERKSQVFVVATANDISALPPELVRKGRFDEIFFVDLPDPDVRTSIFAIHLVNREQPLQNFDVRELATASDGFSGAEIEQAIVSSLYTAHARREPLATEHILEEIARTRPLSIVMAERISEMRDWARGRTVPTD